MSWHVKLISHSWISHMQIVLGPYTVYSKKRFSVYLRKTISMINMMLLWWKMRSLYHRYLQNIKGCFIHWGVSIYDYMQL